MIRIFIKTFVILVRIVIFKELKVCVAFGFHVNLYHSFRGDTNDKNGFGKDK